MLVGRHPLTPAAPTGPGGSLPASPRSSVSAASAAAISTPVACGGAAASCGERASRERASSAGGADETPPESLATLRGIVLLQVKRYSATSPLGVSARQVVARPEYLDSGDVFLVVHAARRALLVWRGAHALPSLAAASLALAQRICAAQPTLRLQNVDEGAEPLRL